MYFNKIKNVLVIFTFIILGCQNQTNLQVKRKNNNLNFSKINKSSIQKNSNNKYYSELKHKKLSPSLKNILLFVTGLFSISEGKNILNHNNYYDLAPNKINSNYLNEICFVDENLFVSLYDNNNKESKIKDLNNIAKACNLLYSNIELEINPQFINPSFKFEKKMLYCYDIIDNINPFNNSFTINQTNKNIIDSSSDIIACCNNYYINSKNIYLKKSDLLKIEIGNGNISSKNTTINNNKGMLVKFLEDLHDYLVYFGILLFFGPTAWCTLNLIFNFMLLTCCGIERKKKEKK